MAAFRFVTLWRIEAPIDAVYRALTEPRDWPRWWPSLTDVQALAPGDAQGIGGVYRYRWQSRLGYRLCFNIRVTQVCSSCLIEGEATGDVQGVGRWRLAEEGGVTRVRYEWRVRTTRRWMNLAAPLARPLFTWSHHAVMQEGATGLARWLDARLLETVREGEAGPALVRSSCRSRR